MVTIGVSITGAQNVAGYIAQLPAKLRKTIFAEGSIFMKDMQQNMILMAPEDTGFLKSQITLNTNGYDTITIDTGDAYYGRFQELGFTAHIIPVGYIGQHKLAPSLPGIYTLPPFVYVSKHTPFIEPAFINSISKLNSGLNIALTRAL